VEVFDPPPQLFPFSWPRVLVIRAEPRGGPNRKQRFQQFFCCCYGRLPSDSPDIVDMLQVVTKQQPVSLSVSRSLPSNGYIQHNMITDCEMVE
jgi:hypothetical protein